MVPILHLLQGWTGILGYEKVTMRAWQMGKGAGVTPGIQLAQEGRVHRSGRGMGRVTVSEGWRLGQVSRTQGDLLR